MDRLLSLRRSALIYGSCLLVAILLGYFLAVPLSYRSLGAIALVLGILSLPVLMRWHHPLLILTWNAALIMPFLPGQPNWWMCLSFISLALAVLLRIMTQRGDFLRIPSVSFWVLFLLVTAGVTAKLTGGIGARAFGSTTYGAKGYLYVFSAIAGYFALIGARIRPEQAKFLAVGFFLSGVTTAVSDLVAALGSKFYWLFYFFPFTFGLGQLTGEATSVERFTGLSFGAESALLALLAGYGLRNIFDWARPWRLILFCLLIVAVLFGGFRSLIIVLFLLLVFQLYFEGLFTLRNTAIVAGSLILLSAALFAFSVKLPEAVQRSLSFLPVSVADNVRRDAAGTADWRWTMWKVLLPEVPKYLWLGKGFTFNGTDLYLTQEGIRRGYYEDYESAVVSGNYHNGVFTVIIPFGIWGMVGLTGFFVASFRALYLNYRNGDPPLKVVNALLLSWFLARLVMYFTVYGSFDTDFPLFVGLVGLSLCMNHGIKTTNRTEAPVAGPP